MAIIEMKNEILRANSNANAREIDKMLVMSEVDLDAIRSDALIEMLEALKEKILQAAAI
jgi:hypothetical protein